MIDLAKALTIEKINAARRMMERASPDRLGRALRAHALDVMLPGREHFMAALIVEGDPRHGVSHGAMVAARLSEAAVLAAAKASHE